MTKQELDELLDEFGYLIRVDAHPEYKNAKRKLIQEEFKRVNTLNVILLKTLDEVEWVLHSSGKLYCPWCHGIRPNHMTDCPRLFAVQTAKEQKPDILSIM